MDERKRQLLIEDGERAARDLGYELPEEWCEMALDWCFRHDTELLGVLLDGATPTDETWARIFSDLEFSKK